MSQWLHLIALRQRSQIMRSLSLPSTLLLKCMNIFTQRPRRFSASITPTLGIQAVTMYTLGISYSAHVNDCTPFQPVNLGAQKHMSMNTSWTLHPLYIRMTARSSISWSDWVFAPEIISVVQPVKCPSPYYYFLTSEFTPSYPGSDLDFWEHSPLLIWSPLVLFLGSICEGLSISWAFLKPSFDTCATEEAFQTPRWTSEILNSGDLHKTPILNLAPLIDFPTLLRYSQLVLSLAEIYLHLTR